MSAAKNKVSTLLVADDDSVVLKLIGFNFDRAGLYCDLFESGDELLAVVSEETQACVLDLNMPGTGGLDCLKKIKSKHPHVEVVILTNGNQAAEAVEAVRAGAFDYITKPFDPDWLVKTVRKAMQSSRQCRENSDLRSSITESHRELRVLGESTTMRSVWDTLGRYAPSDKAVLFTGESGTGKTLLARMVHAQSRRAEGPFVAVSCPSLPGELLESEMFGHEKGAFSGANRRRLGRAELANGGTLFLDEIGEMPLRLQTKLLTFLQDRSFFRLGGEKSITSDVRIVAATNQDLEARVKDGSFREDLFFRLNVLPLEVPPLRDRKGDVSLLLDHFLRENAASEGTDLPEVDPAVYLRLEAYAWPGNIRELENAVARAFTIRRDPKWIKVGDFLNLADSGHEELASDGENAAAGPKGGFTLGGKSLAEIEKEAIVQTLGYCKGNKAEAARTLGIAEKSIYNKMKKHGIS